METLRPIDGGTVIIDGIDVAKKILKRSNTLSVSSHKHQPFRTRQKLVEIIEMFAAAYGERVDAMQFLRDVDLEEKGEQLRRESFWRSETTSQHYDRARAWSKSILP